MMVSLFILPIFKTKCILLDKLLIIMKLAYYNIRYTQGKGTIGSGIYGDPLIGFDSCNRSPGVDADNMNLFL
jgi:hypothetical protein